MNCFLGETRNQVLLLSSFTLLVFNSYFSLNSPIYLSRLPFWVITLPFMGTGHCNCRCLAEPGDELFPNVSRGPKNTPGYDDELMTGGNLRLFPNTPLELRINTALRSYTNYEDVPTAADAEYVLSETKRSRKNLFASATTDCQLEKVPEEGTESEFSFIINGIPLDEVPQEISTAKAKEIHKSLEEYKFSKGPQKPWSGPVLLEDGSVYIGQWNCNGQPHGQGQMYYFEGGIAEGQWANGKLDGQGRYVSSTGDIYTGEWVNGQRYGLGSIVYERTHETYEGHWVHDKPEGFGKEQWKDGASFEGVYLAGKKQGQGVIHWANGSKYKGMFVQDKIEGQGVYKWANGNRYRGEWKEGKMHGFGVFKHAKGQVYEGEFVGGLKDGWGVEVSTSGKKQEGFWKKGRKIEKKNYLKKRGSRQSIIGAR